MPREAGARSEPLWAAGEPVWLPCVRPYPACACPSSACIYPILMVRPHYLAEAPCECPLLSVSETAHTKHLGLCMQVRPHLVHKRRKFQGLQRSTRLLVEVRPQQADK